MKHFEKKMRIDPFEDAESVTKFAISLRDDPKVINDSINIKKYADPYQTLDVYIFEWDERPTKKPVKQHTWRRKSR